MRATFMEELEFLRMQLLHLMSQSWRPWLLGMLNANTSATPSESEVQSEAIDLDDEEVGV